MSDAMVAVWIDAKALADGNPNCVLAKDLSTGEVVRGREAMGGAFAVYVDCLRTDGPRAWLEAPRGSVVVR